MQKNYSDEELSSIWAKGDPVSGYNSSEFRQDECTAWMKRDEYGNRNSKLGWEVDHITPVSNGGGENLSNLRPLQWENNVSKSDGKLVCAVKSDGNKNVDI
jgi:hypothetical protein